MHGQHCEERQHQWHMRPGPSQRPDPGIVADSASVKCFSKAGRKIGVGDCALFQAGNAPPFIGIIRRLFAEKDGDLKLSVNWLYRPGDIKLGKGASIEAAPNEVFYSFHKDDISAASLLHPCKVAFLRKGVELPSGVSSFLCRRVYDIASKCLHWLTDQDFTDGHQDEVNELLDRTKLEMQAAVQSGVTSQIAQSGPTSSQPRKADVLNAGFSDQCKGKKRERTDQTLEPCKRERSMKLEDSDLGFPKPECNMKLEDITNIADKDGGLTNITGVDQLVQAMNQEQNDSVKKTGDVVSRRTFIASIVAATEREDCLTRFVQLKALLVLDEWLQEAHKGKVGDGGSPKEGDRGVDDLLLTLLRALEKLPVDLDALKTCHVGKSVNNLRSHRNLEIQKKSRKLVETWKKRVNAEMKSGSNSTVSLSCKQLPNDTNVTKGWSANEGGSVKSTGGVKPALNGSDPKGSSIPASGCREPPGFSSNSTPKDKSGKGHASGTGEVLLAVVKEEKSSSSSQSQNNSQSWCSGSVKGGGSWKEEFKTSPAVSTGTKTATTTLRSHHSGKGQPTGSQNGGGKELVGGKNSLWNKTSGNEKVASPSLMEKGAAESVRAENLNNQRLIVRLPNPGRSPARCSSGVSFVDGGAPVSRGSSPGSLERFDSIDGKNKMCSDAPVVHSPETSGDAKTGSGNVSVGKSGVDCIEEKERSSMITDIDVDSKSSNAEHRPQESESSFHHSKRAGKVQAETVPGRIVKKGTAAVAALGSSSTSHEFHANDVSEGGIDLLASVAACEGSETEKSFSGITSEGLAHAKDGNSDPAQVQARVKDGNSDPAKQMRPLEELDSENQDGDFIAASLDDEMLKDSSTKLTMKSSLEQGVMGERPNSGTFPVDETTCAAEDLSEQIGVSIAEERARDGATESTLLSTSSFVVAKDVNVSVARETEVFAGSHDGYGGAKVVRGETSEEKVIISRLSTDICNAKSLTQECQTGAFSGLDEGFENTQKDATSSPSSLVRTVSIADAVKAVESGSAYYEEDALEVACQVAKEVEQEMEQYGKPEAQELNSINVCKSETRRESPICETAKDGWISTSDADPRVTGPGQCGHCTDAVVHSDDSQETVTEKREEMEAHRIPSGKEGEEVDQVGGSLSSPEKVRPALESALDSAVSNIKELRDMVIGEEDKHLLPAAVQEGAVDAAVCKIQAGDVPAVVQAAALTFASNDGKGSGSDTSGRPAFDLNEGLVADEALSDEATPLTVSPLNPTVLVADSPSVPPAMSISLAAPIAVVAATKGAFIPPSNPLKGKGELGWKGSAATSAFRPAEPRRTAETLQSPSDAAGMGTVVDGVRQSGKQARFLDIDLNVADDKAVEDVGMPSVRTPQTSVLGMVFHATSPGSSCKIPMVAVKENSSSGLNNSPLTSRPELDLNRVVESEESMSPAIPDSRGLEVSGRSNNGTHVMRDFDLNGPGFEESLSEEPALQQSNAKNVENSVLPALSGTRPKNPELVNVPSWYPAASPLHSMMMPPLSASRAESPYPIVATANAKSVITMGNTLGPFNNDLYRAGAVSSSPTVSYSTTMTAPFPYAGFSFGSGFQFTSASYNMSSTPYVASTSSSPFPSAPSQLVSAGAVVSPYGRPLFMGITEIPGAETSASWSRQNLDLNAGPDALETDGREEGLGARQMPVIGQLSFQQVGSAGGAPKRKEPEGGFDPFRSGFKQMAWR